MRNFWCALWIVSAASVAIPTVQAEVIDSFESGAFSLADNNPNDNSAAGIVQPGLVGVIGTERWSSAFIWNGTGPSADLTLDLSGPGDHGATFNLPGGGTGTAGFYYPGTSGAGLGVDLTAGGADAFQLLFSADPGNGSVAISVGSDLGILNFAFPLTGDGTYQIPFSEFNPQQGEFSQVNDLYFEVVIMGGAQPISATISDIRTVPEPGAGVLFVFAASALKWNSRRKLRP